LGIFDSLEFIKDSKVNEIRRYREAEVTHGRVSILAVLGYLVGNNLNSFFDAPITEPTNTHLSQV